MPEGSESQSRSHDKRGEPSTAVLTLIRASDNLTSTAGSELALWVFCWPRETSALEVARRRMPEGSESQSRSHDKRGESSTAVLTLIRGILRLAVWPWPPASRGVARAPAVTTSPTDPCSGFVGEGHSFQS